MNRKAKGISAERELLRRFWDAGWAAVRTPASGAARFPSPDVIASNRLRHLAIECKATGESGKYLSSDDLLGLRGFSERFGAEPWVGVRFDGEGWYFIPLENLRKTKGGYGIRLDEAKLLSLSFEEMIEQE